MGPFLTWSVPKDPSHTERGEGPLPHMRKPPAEAPGRFLLEGSVVAAGTGAGRRQPAR
jgi:hypothetical protein